MIRHPDMVGDTFADILNWRWNRSRMQYEATHRDRLLLVRFHKIGGRWNRTLPDGTPNPWPHESYWTIEVDYERRSLKFKTADEAKAAAAEEYRRRFAQEDA